jgi:5-methyltetrahydrofolate--homocysteine methyltransferase
MTTTLDRMAEAVEALRGAVASAVLVGGAPVTSRFAEQIGADGTAEDAAGAVTLVRRALGDGSP